MKVYALTRDIFMDTHDDYTGSDMNLFGVFSSRKLAEKKADEMGWPIYQINEVELDQPTEIYLGGYFED